MDIKNLDPLAGVAAIERAGREMSSALSRLVVTAAKEYHDAVLAVLEVPPATTDLMEQSVACGVAEFDGHGQEVNELRVRVGGNYEIMVSDYSHRDRPKLSGKHRVYVFVVPVKE